MTGALRALAAALTVALLGWPAMDGRSLAATQGDATRGDATQGDLGATASGSDVAVMGGLDKITARISRFRAPVGRTVKFGTLAITARRCYTRPPTEPPENAAFLEIVDDRPDLPPVPIFSGWMFASSPALSALEHPVYDVWVVMCEHGG